jgi:hypothetical protein
MQQNLKEDKKTSRKSLDCKSHPTNRREGRVRGILYGCLRTRGEGSV